MWIYGTYKLAKYIPDSQSKAYKTYGGQCKGLQKMIYISLQHSPKSMLDPSLFQTLVSNDNYKQCD